MNFTAAHKHTLLNIADWSIIDYLEHGKRKFDTGKYDIDDVLRSKLGVFVTVYVNKNLRGCIGTFSESEPLYENVNRMSVQAAFQDNRFKPVCKNEISSMEVEISVLTPRIKIRSPEEIIIGKHGIYMIHGIRRATLLPQVAVKNNWTALEFLECCSRNKLGMNKSSWKEAELFVYEAIVFR